MSNDAPGWTSEEELLRIVDEANASITDEERERAIRHGRVVSIRRVASDSQEDRAPCVKHGTEDPRVRRCIRCHGYGRVESHSVNDCIASLSQQIRVVERKSARAPVAPISRLVASLSKWDNGAINSDALADAFHDFQRETANGAGGAMSYPSEDQIADADCPCQPSRPAQNCPGHGEGTLRPRPTP